MIFILAIINSLQIKQSDIILLRLNIISIESLKEAILKFIDQLNI